jgi:uridine phosphorylase
MAAQDDEPHLIPEKTVGMCIPRNFYRDRNITIAFIGFCPPPARMHLRPESEPEPRRRDIGGSRIVFPQEKESGARIQQFIHLSPDSVSLLKIYPGENRKSITVLSLCHVYGSCVTTAIVEELAYYGIRYVLAYGYAGALQHSSLAVGDWFLVGSALARDGATKYYTTDEIVPADREFIRLILQSLLGESDETCRFHVVRALTDDVIYRERPSLLKEAEENGCQIANCDSSHLYAACRTVGIQVIECGIVSNVDGHDDLGDVITGGKCPASGRRNAAEELDHLVDALIATTVPSIILGETQSSI